MAEKLIIPAELKICATCSYWDGLRKVDPELRLVVIDECAEGECLVKCACRRGLNNEGTGEHNCLWEHLAPDSDPTQGSDNDAQ